ncbi:MAG: AMP-binding protein [Myxococcales bacterium]|nr:AMP-binding protein [Myxococcales bacterium]
MIGRPLLPADAPCNIARALVEMAERQPETPAIYYPEKRRGDGTRDYSRYTYRELDDRSDAIARGLQAVGIGPGVRTALMVRPSLDFFALFFGMFKAGAVPVLVDPGIGIKRLKECLDEAEPTAFVGIPVAQLARVLLGWGKKTIKTRVTVGRRWLLGDVTLDDAIATGAAGAGQWQMAETRAGELAAILFTSGSTGVPKGVMYEHRHFAAQVELIRTAYDIQPGEIDLPTFPPFALFDPALGMTTVIPEMDPTRPASVNPDNLFEAVRTFGVTNLFGSPALLDTVSRAGAARGVKLPTLKRVISAGAPVSPEVMARMLSLLPDGARIHTPYGATECLPVATVDSALILSEARAKTAAGAGVCVGTPLVQNDVRVIRCDDGPIEAWRAELEVPSGEVGEITVRGPTTTQAYYGRAASTALAKIRHPDDPEGWLRHRMGDLGYFDADGRLWFCGRKSHRLETQAGPMYTVPCEMVFNAHPAVRRSALVGVPAGDDVRPVILIERDAAGPELSEAALVAELRALAERFPHTRRIDTFLTHPAFPVDIRHNAKIDRPQLAQWAARRLK